MPKVSVIMSVFNGGAFLVEAIESILSQSLSDFEFIIINDGSTDNSFDVVEYYAKRDPRVLAISRENRGIFSSLNEALMRSSGKYIAIADADDISSPERLAAQSLYLDEQPQCGVVGVALYSDHAKKNWFRRIGCPEECKWGLLFFSTIGHPGAMIRRSTLVGAGVKYNESYGYGADYKLWCDLADVGEIHFINRPLVFYRLHANAVSVVRRNDQEGVRRRIQIEQFKKWLGIELPPFCEAEYKKWAGILCKNLFGGVSGLRDSQDWPAIHWAFQEFSAKAGWGVFAMYMWACFGKKDFFFCFRLRHVARVLSSSLKG